MLHHSKSVAKSTNQTRRAGRHSATDPDSFFGEEELENNNNNNNDNNNNESPPQLRALEKYGCKPSCAIFPCTLFSQCCALSPPRLPVGRGNTLSGCGYGGGCSAAKASGPDRLLAGFIPDSKHRFTTSFLQPLPYLVTP